MISAVLLAAATAATAPQAPCALVASERVMTSSGGVRIGDIVDLACVTEDDRENLAALIVMELPGSVREQTIGRDALASLVRRRAPVLRSMDANGPGAITFVRDVEARPSTQDFAECFAASRPIADGEPLQNDDVVSTTCKDQTTAPLAYDREAQLSRATGDIEAGAYVGPLARPSAGRIESGEEVSVEASAGVVEVDRIVITLQAADLGGQAFVRGADGTIFSATISLPIQQVAGP